MAGLQGGAAGHAGLAELMTRHTDETVAAIFLTTALVRDWRKFCERIQGFGGRELVVAAGLIVLAIITLTGLPSRLVQ
jgi:hypothetical protein